MNKRVETDACVVPTAYAPPPTQTQRDQFDHRLTSGLRTPSSGGVGESVGGGDFRVKLLNISQQLVREDLARLKFLLKNELSRRDLDEAKDARQIFDLLMKNGCMTGNDFSILTDLLVAMNHRKLARELNGGSAVAVDQRRHRVDPWLLALLKCSDDVGEKSFKAIKFILGDDADFLDKSRLESARSILDLVLILEDGGSSAHQIRTKIQNWMKALGRKPFDFDSAMTSRQDSATERELGVELRVNGYNVPTMTTAGGSGGGRGRSSLQNPTSVATPSTNTRVTRSSSSTNQIRLAQNVSFSRLKQSSSHQQRQHQPPPQQKQQRKFDPKQEYDPNGKGLCVIVNNENFWKDIYEEDAKSGLPPRNGTEADEKVLKHLFSDLGYDLHVEKDKTAEEIRKLVAQIAQADLSQWGALIFIVLSHGKEMTVYGSDGVPVKIDDIMEPFSSRSCPHMTGKPKVFLIQACQGENAESLPIVHGDGGDTGLTMNRRAGEATDNPSLADFFVGFATVQGFESYRTPEGTWFIKALERNIRQYAFQDQKHFSDIFVRVNNEVSMERGRKQDDLEQRVVKQMPLFKSTLRKDFYLKRILD